MVDEAHVCDNYGRAVARIEELEARAEAAAVSTLGTAPTDEELDRLYDYEAPKVESWRRMYLAGLAAGRAAEAASRQAEVDRLTARVAELGAELEETAQHGLEVANQRDGALDRVASLEAKSRVELTTERRASLLAWLSERYEEMRPDAKSIRDEAPHLLPAIRSLLKALKKETPRAR
jgi:hypothetical protein